MKKFLIFFTSLFFLCSNVVKVNADESEVAYDIESIVVSNDTITISGWGYMRRVNNIGGESLFLSLTATNGSVGSAGITKKVDNYIYQDLYPIMCVRTVAGNKCHPKTEHESRCTEAADYDGCLYDNGRFVISYGLKELYEKFGTDEIFFDLKVETPSKTRTVRIGAYEKNVKNQSTKWKTEVDFTNSVYVSVKSTPFYQALSGERFQPEQRWQLDQVIDVNVYKRLTFKGSVATGNSFVTLGAYCNYQGQCAYASWVTASKIFILKLEEEEKKECFLNDSKSLFCNDGNFSSSCDINVDAGTVYASGSGGCSGGSATVEATINISQTGELKFNLDRGPIYSGGGFTFDIVYNNSASWNYSSGGYQGCPLITVGYRGTCKETVKKDNPDGTFTIETNYYSCCKSKTVKSPDCQNDADYEEFIEKAVANKYQGLDESNAVVTMPDSNSVGGGNNNKTGIWECEGPNLGSRWAPNTKLNSTCKFTLYNAYIEKNSSKVFYNISGGNKYLEQGAMYFIPLKYPTDLFPVNVSLSKLSSITNMKWSATYECDVNCQQKLYDLEEGGYLYYFRPISLSQPFPNRSPGKNWFDWIESGGNLERLADTYTSNNNIEYYVTLTNTDIANIKKYNSDMNYEGKGYLNYSIDVNGTSEFIKKYNYFTLGNPNHSALGVFNSEDDMQ